MRVTRIWVLGLTRVQLDNAYVPAIKSIYNPRLLIILRYVNSSSSCVTRPLYDQNKALSLRRMCKPHLLVVQSWVSVSCNIINYLKYLNNIHYKTATENFGNSAMKTSVLKDVRSLATFYKTTYICTTKTKIIFYNLFYS